MFKTDILLFDSIGFSEAAVKAVIKLVYLTRHRYRWSIVLLSVLLVTWSVLSQVYKWCWIICTKGIFCQVSTNTLDQSTLDWHLAWHLINIWSTSWLTVSQESQLIFWRLLIITYGLVDYQLTADQALRDSHVSIKILINCWLRAEYWLRYCSSVDWGLIKNIN